MTKSPSRLERADHPPMSRALKRVMTVLGVSGMDLARALDRSQSAVARYYADREPDYAMALEIERALRLPRGSLFSLAGYAPQAASCDVLAAVMDDPTLQEGQRFAVLFTVIEALTSKGRRGEPSADALRAAEADERLSEHERRVIAEMVRGFREQNQAVAQPAKRKRTIAAR